MQTLADAQTGYPVLASASVGGSAVCCRGWYCPRLSTYTSPHQRPARRTTMDLPRRGLGRHLSWYGTCASCTRTDAGPGQASSGGVGGGGGESVDHSGLGSRHKQTEPGMGEGNSPPSQHRARKAWSLESNSRSVPSPIFRIASNVKLLFGILRQNLVPIGTRFFSYTIFK